MANRDKFIPYESLTTLQLFDKYIEAVNNRDSALARRGERGGIALARDFHAREWQRADNLIAMLQNVIRERLAAGKGAE